MKVLVACEFSGIVRNAFVARGHDAWSCDLLPSETEGNHIQGDVLEILDQGWDLMIGHPPCTHLATSGAAWFKYKRKEQKLALVFFLSLLQAPIKRICLENPMSVISTRIIKPSQVIQPYWFGDEEQKTTWLWLKNLPPLQSTKMVKPVLIAYKSKDTKSGYKLYPRWHQVGGGKDRGHNRSRTFRGIAEAMADQWGSLPLDWKEGFGL